jgi:hypothetical protein
MFDWFRKPTSGVPDCPNIPPVPKPVIVNKKGEARPVDEEKKTRKVVDNQLALVMRDGTILSWTLYDVDSNKRIEPWRHFYRWFYERDSDFYTMKAKEAISVIRKDDIVRFEIRLVENEVEI